MAQYLFPVSVNTGLPLRRPAGAGASPRLTRATTRSQTTSAGSGCRGAMMPRLTPVRGRRLRLRRAFLGTHPCAGIHSDTPYNEGCKKGFTSGYKTDVNKGYKSGCGYKAGYTAGYRRRHP